MEPSLPEFEHAGPWFKTRSRRDTSKFTLKGSGFGGVGWLTNTGDSDRHRGGANTLNGSVSITSGAQSMPIQSSQKALGFLSASDTTLAFRFLATSRQKRAWRPRTLFSRRDPIQLMAWKQEALPASLETQGTGAGGCPATLPKNPPFYSPELR